MAIAASAVSGGADSRGGRSEDAGFAADDGELPPAELVFATLEQQFQFDLLRNLVEDLSAFLDPDPATGTLANMRERMTFADAVYAWSVRDHQEEWEQAIASIADEKVPESLRNKISLFSKRGWVAPIDSHLIDRSDWTAVFILLGLFPGQYDRIIERIPASELDQNLRDLKSRIEKVAAEFPPHGMYLNAMKSTPENRA